MALGVSSFPTVSTGFNAEDSAMMPVTSGNTSNLQQMSTSDTMKEVFFDIRDGITNLAKTFSDKISGLNKHLAFRLEKLNSTMSTIGSIAAEDLNIENQTFDQMQENQSLKDRQRSLGNQGEEPIVGGPGLIDVLKEDFKSLIDFLTPKRESVKVGLLGMLALGIAAFLPDIEKIFENIFRFFDKKFVPFLKELPAKLDTLFDKFKAMDFSWKQYLGMGLGAYLGLKLGKLLLLRAFLVPGGFRVLGYVGLAVWAISSVFKKAGQVVAAKDWTKEMGASDSQKINQIAALLAGNLKGGITNAFSNASDFAIAGIAIGAFGGPVGMLIGGVVGAVIGGILGWIGAAKIASTVDDSVTDLVKLWNESGVVGLLDLSFGAFYDVVIAKIFKGVNYIFGGILRLAGFDDVGRQIQGYSYSWDGLKNEITLLFDMLSNVIQDSVIDIVNFFLPKSMHVGKDKMAIDTYNSMEAFKQNRPDLYEPGGANYKEYMLLKKKVYDIDPERIIGRAEFERNFDLGPYKDKFLADGSYDDRPSIPFESIVDGSYDNTLKKRLADAKEDVTKIASSPVIIPIDSSTKSNISNYNNSSYTGTPRVDAMEPASAALLDYFRR